MSKQGNYYYRLTEKMISDIHENKCKLRLMFDNATPKAELIDGDTVIKEYFLSTDKLLDVIKIFYHVHATDSCCMLDINQEQQASIYYAIDKNGLVCFTGAKRLDLFNKLDLERIKKLSFQSRVYEGKNQYIVIIG